MVSNKLESKQLVLADGCAMLRLCRFACLLEQDGQRDRAPCSKAGPLTRRGDPLPTSFLSRKTKSSAHFKRSFGFVALALFLSVSSHF